MSLHGPQQKAGLTTFSRVIILTAIYFVGGLLGKEGSFKSGDLALVWPPSGIAVAAILLFGFRFWPGVALGAVLFSLLNGQPFGFFTLGTAIGNSVGAVVCAFLLKRIVGFRNSMDRVVDVVGFVLLACVVGTTVNAAFNVVSLGYAGEVDWDDLFPTMLEWWVPNAMGVLVVTPFLLSLGSPSPVRWTPARIIEGIFCVAFLLAGMVAVQSYVFYGLQNYPLAYLPFPFLVWAALRFGQRGAALTTLIVSGAAIFTLLHDKGPFVTDSETESLMLIGSYIGILAITNMLLAAVATERKHAEEALRESQRMFQLISENVSDLIAVTDAQGRRLYNSPVYSRLLGAPQELAGTDAFEQIHPEDRDRVRQAFQTTLATGVGQRLEYRFVLGSGEVRHIESQGNYIPESEGAMGKVVSVSRDITDRKAADERLRLLASAVRFADDVIMITRSQKESGAQEIVFVNPAFSRMTLYAPDEALGKTIEILYGPRTDSEVLDRLNSAFSKGEPFQGEAINYTKAGAEFYNEWHVQPIRDDSGAVTHFLTVARDVTPRKQIEADLEKARDAALTSARAKADFLARMSHEIRTPMNGVIGMTGLLLQTDLRPQQRDFVETIRKSSDVLLTVINDILDFSKIEAGKLQLETLNFDLTEVVEVTVELLSSQALAKDVELTGHVEPGTPCRLRGDAGRVRQILVNLTNNALKFTERGEVAVRAFTKEANESGAIIRFEVRDTGVGIPEDVQPKLFKAFSQADESTTRRFGGTGLGLAICRELATMMNGAIGAESKPGQGSVFWFELPFERQQEESDEDQQDQDALLGLRILVVDDHETNRRIISQQARFWRMTCEEASSGDEALKIMRHAAEEQDAFDLAVLDLQMPGMSGLELARAVKQDPLLRKTRLVLLSSLGGDSLQEEAKTIEMDGWLVKPVKSSRLFDALMSAMGTSMRDKLLTSRSRPAKEIKELEPSQRKKVRILIAEDNIINQRVTSSQLELLGYSADVVANGLEVLNALQHFNYDIILMDCQMPEMDGYEATRRIRKAEAAGLSSRPRVHIIAMTAHALQGDRELCLGAGMDDYLSKPVDDEDLREALGRWIPRPGWDASPAAAPAPGPAGSSHQKAPESGTGPQGKGKEKEFVDTRQIARMTGGDPDEIEEIINLYTSQCQELIEKIESGLQSNDADQVKRAAHKLAGASAAMGANSIVAPLRALEALAGQGALKDATPLLDKARVERGAIEQFLTEYQKKAKSA